MCLTEKMSKGSAKEGSIDGRMADIARVVEVPAAGTVEFHSVESGQVRATCRQAELRLAMHARAAAKVATRELLRHRFQAPGREDVACMR